MFSLYCELEDTRVFKNMTSVVSFPEWLPGGLANHQLDVLLLAGHGHLIHTLRSFLDLVVVNTTA